MADAQRVRGTCVGRSGDGGLVKSVRALRGCAAVAVAGGLLLAGCSDGGGKPSAEGRPSTGGQASTGGKAPEPTATSPDGAAPSATSTLPPLARFEPDPVRLPRTTAQASRVIDEVITGKELFGGSAVWKNDNDRGRWAVLDEDCVWGQQSLPSDVLASLTRHFEVPPAAGKGLLRLVAVVTVHRTAEDADWETSSMLEEMLRCPTQRLTADEQLADLVSLPAQAGEHANSSAQDLLVEFGTYRGNQRGRSYPYLWEQSRMGQFTIAVSAKGADGYESADILRQLFEAATVMQLRLKAAVGDAADPVTSAEPETGPQTGSDTEGAGTAEGPDTAGGAGA